MTTNGMGAHPGSSASNLVRRLARVALTVAVRGRHQRGGPWGEAALSEFAQTRGRWEAVRWSVGGIRAALRERRALRRQLPRSVRIQRQIIAAVVIGLVAAAGVQYWVLTPVYQPSGSMEPTLHIGDRWLMDRVSFRITGLRYGDVIAFEQTDAGSRFTAVRRIIGLPGDSISCRDGLVLRNGVILDEPYLDEPTAMHTDCAPLTVPAGTVYVLSDARQDTREWSPVAVDRIEGRLLTRL